MEPQKLKIMAQEKIGHIMFIQVAYNYMEEVGVQMVKIYLMMW